SPNSARRWRSELLIADCVIPTCRAARLTLFAAISASNATNRLRLVAEIFIREISNMRNICSTYGWARPKIARMPSDASLPERLLATDRDRTLLFQRILLGVVIFPHGAQKLLGWFGGYGFSGTMGFFTDTMHIPGPIALLIIIAESFGAIGLVL